MTAQPDHSLPELMIERMDQLLPADGAFEPAAIAAIDLGIGGFLCKFSIADLTQAHVALSERIIAGSVGLPMAMTLGGFGIACAAVAVNRFWH